MPCGRDDLLSEAPLPAISNNSGVDEHIEYKAGEGAVIMALFSEGIFS